MKTSRGLPSAALRVMILGLGLTLLRAPSARAADARVSEVEALTSRLAAGKPITLASFGDSITWPCFHTDFRQNYLTLTADALRKAYPAAQITLVNGGNMGTAARGLDTDRFSRHVLSRRPDLVFLMFGMNDCLGGQVELEAYDRNLTTLIAKARASGALPVVCTQNEILYDADDGKLRQALPLYVARALRVARRERVPAVDCFAQWKGLATAPDSLVDRLNDAIHPNLSGKSGATHDRIRPASVPAAELSESGRGGACNVEREATQNGPPEDDRRQNSEAAIGQPTLAQPNTDRLLAIPGRRRRPHLSGMAAQRSGSAGGAAEHPAEALHQV